MTMAPEISQLQEQQALLTDSLARMLTGEWTGFPSLEANLMALSPGIELAPDPPLLESETALPPAPGWRADYDPNTYMPPQKANWTCSACALAWVLRATQLDPSCDESAAVAMIGNPENINSTYGLMDGSGSQLRRVLADYGVDSHQAWLTFDDAYATYCQTIGMMSGGAWYHWVAVRGTGDGSLWIANSAPGYMGVWDVLNRSDFQRLGPFSCVWLV